MHWQRLPKCGYNLVASQVRICLTVLLTAENMLIVKSLLSGGSLTYGWVRLFSPSAAESILII